MSLAFLRRTLIVLSAPAILGVGILEDDEHAAAADPAGPPRLVQGPPGPVAPAAVIRLYRAVCLECHDTDGRGEIARDVMPKVPDFTDAAWHAKRSDTDLRRSILEGRGKSMPPMRGKLGSVEVGQMVAFVRAFRGGKQVVDEDEEKPAVPQPSVAPLPAVVSRSRSTESPRPGPNDLSFGEGSRMFRRSCARCHAMDGRGGEMREVLPNIPDFTDRTWQEARADSQLVVSVLDGKGTGMPPFRDKLSREQARDLVEFIRSFDPSWTLAPRTPTDDFEARFEQLLAEFEELRRRSRALSADGAATRGGSDTPGSSAPLAPAPGPPR